MRKNKGISAACGFLGAFLLLSCAAFAQDSRKVVVYHSLSCQKCMQAKAEVFPELQKEFANRVYFEYRDLADIDNYKMLLGLKESYKSDIKIIPPVIFCAGRFINGENDLKNDLRKLILASLQEPVGQEKFGRADLKEVFRRFSLLGVALAALEDGINPCAFTVIVFFISFLALQGYRKRQMIAIGLSFITAVFATYLLIGLGIFNFLYSLKGFWLVTRAVNLTVGILSIALGCLALYDFFKFKKTGSSEGLVLQLPQAVKNRIHAVIGTAYRKPRSGQAESGLVKLIISAFVTGFLVTLLEAVCTGQLYLPTIIFILKTAEIKTAAVLYLVLYNVLFVAPLFAVLLLAFAGVSSGQFAAFLKKHMAAIKIFMAGIFFALGVLLLWKI